jgi:hypothetical protein
MDEDTDTSIPYDIYERRQNEAVFSDPVEDIGPKIPDGGTVDRIDTGSNGEERKESFDDEGFRKKYKRFREKYDRLQEKHIRTQDELNDELRTQNENLIDEYGDLIELLEKRKENYEELESAYKELRKYNRATTDKLIYTLGNFSETEKSSALWNTFQGGLFAIAGFLAADQYSVDGAIDFYANAASNYTNNPETMVLTLGLPLLGALYLQNAYSSWSNSRELDEAADTWRKRRSDAEDFDSMEHQISNEWEEIEVLEFE